MAEGQLALSRRSALTSIAGALCLPGTVRAQADFPNRSVKIIVPLAPGGGGDRLVRVLAEGLAQAWGHPVVVDNRPGGGAVVGTLATIRAPADGYTLGLFGSALSINAIQPGERPYELKQVQPVARIGFQTEALFAVASFPADDVKSLVALAKSRAPNTFAYGSNGIGSSAELAGEMLNQMGGVRLQHIPYNGAARMFADMLGGQLPLGIAVMSSALPHIASGQLKVLGVTSSKRSALFPQFPAMGETLPGFDAGNWAGICAPAGTPAVIVQRIARGIITVLQDSQMRKAIADLGVELAPLEPAEFGSFISEEVARFSKLQTRIGASGGRS